MSTQGDAASRGPPTAEWGVIEVRLREVRQLFDAMDPAPFREKDLDPDAEEYIVESAKELPSRAPTGLVIHLDESTGLPDEERAVGDAVRAHFARQSRLLRRKLVRLLRRGLVSLGIGAAFLAALFVLARLVGHLMGESALAALFREGLLIGGWVAMWRPLEIFLYDWWPISGEQRLHERLSRIVVRVVPGSSRAPDALGRLLVDTAVASPRGSPSRDANANEVPSADGARLPVAVPSPERLRDEKADDVPTPQRSGAAC
jgi:hypothetical protein